MTDVSIEGRLDVVLRGLAGRVRQLREQRDLSVVGLSFESGLSESRVRAIEAGRTTASLATLVALAETFEIELSALFVPDEEHHDLGEEPSSPYVVPSEVVWGGPLPPAPWLTPAIERPASSPYVVPSDVVWGGDLPAAPWTTAAAAPAMPAAVAPSATEPPPVTPPVVPAPSFAPTEAVWGGPLPPAPWATNASAAAPGNGASAASGHAPSAAPAVHDRAAAHGLTETSRYVFVAPAASAPAEPRTFAELRQGALAGRTFPSLREFAIAAVAEAGHSAVVVARVFRLPVWRLEQWVTEAGYVAR